ncbi:MAG: ATP-dependent Clp protease proteolytic subunit [Candidatus Obscuribacterales bacterium]|nr:ATP-dependent Clp protease proteolytic subunit [Candidatus Obscuribacterales bacterium]
MPNIKDEIGESEDREHNDADEEKPSAPPAAIKVGNGRRIYLFGRLDNEIVMPVIKRLWKLNDKDPAKPIDLYINSSGGNGYNADAIIAVMNAIAAPVNTTCLGHALSGACEILAAGTGLRKSYEFATIMFHQTLWEADGDITNLEIQAEQGRKFREAQIELLHRCTGKEKRVIRTDIERDHYLSAEEAVEYGIIDEVIRHKVPEFRLPKSEKSEKSEKSGSEKSSKADKNSKADKQTKSVSSGGKSGKKFKQGI